MWLNQTFEISDYVKDFQPNLGNTIVFGTWTYTWDSGNFGIAILQPVRSTITRRQVLAIRKKSHSLPFLISLVCCSHCESEETMWPHFSCGKVSHMAPWKWWCRHCPFSFNPFVSIFQTGFLTAFCCCPIYIGWLNWFFAVLRGDID